MLAFIYKVRNVVYLTCPMQMLNYVCSQSCPWAELNTIHRTRSTTEAVNASRDNYKDLKMQQNAFKEARPFATNQGLQTFL